MAQVLNELLEEIKSVEPLPQVATRVMQLAAQPDVIPRDLVNVIQTDAGITAKVLKLCNSALYGFKREIASLPEAGNLLGTTTLVNLVLTSCAGRYFRNYGFAEPEATLRLWEQSIATAFAANWVAVRQGSVDRHRAYTAGLLQNLGKLVLARFAHEQAEEIYREISGGKDLLLAEHDLFGMNHAEVGARLAENWSFPPLLVDAIRFHHEPANAQVDTAMASVGHVAEMFVFKLGIGVGPCEPEYAWSESALAECKIAPEQIEALKETLQVELAKARRILEIA